jgi:hypothetical protein
MKIEHSENNTNASNVNGMYLRGVLRVEENDDVSNGGTLF